MYMWQQLEITAAVILQISSSFLNVLSKQLTQELTACALLQLKPVTQKNELQSLAEDRLEKHQRTALELGRNAGNLQESRKQI